jgi:hypothetical protein
MKEDPDGIDWSLTTWQGSRREQIRRWSELTMDEILAAQEEMEEMAEKLSPEAAQKAVTVREEPPRSTEE